MLTLEKLKPQGQQVSITIAQALQKQNYLLKECKILGDKAAKEATNKAWNDLVKAQKQLLDITTALLRINADGDNNRRIKEREMLVRQLEVIEKSEEVTAMKKLRLSAERFVAWIQGKARVNYDSLKESIQKRIEVLTTELIEFNKQEITVNLVI